MRSLKIVTVATLLVMSLAALALTGCGGAGDEAAQSSASGTGLVTGVGAPEAALTDPAAPDADAYAYGEDGLRSAGAPAGTAGPMVIRNAGLELRVKDVDQSVAELRTLVRSGGGEIVELSTGGGLGETPASGTRDVVNGPSFASVVIRVEAERLDALADSLKDLGTVLSQSESSSDVTEQVIDLEARLKNLRAEEARLRTFLDRTNRVSELLAVEAELSRVRGEIESMEAQLTYLERQVARATLTVQLSEPGAVTGTDDPAFRLREAFARGVQGAIGVIEALVTVVVAAIPLVVLFGLGAWTLVVALRRRHTRRDGTSAARDESEPDPAPAGEE